MSSESIVSPPSAVAPAGVGEACASCGAPLAADQRYCLQCGERRTPVSSVLLGGPPSHDRPGAGDGARAASPGGPVPAPASDQAGAVTRGNATTVIAGVGVLLLAMGVGVLIGRSSASSRPTVAAAPQVISVANAPGAGATTSGAEGASFTDDWPAGTNGFTVELQKLPQASTQPSAVEAAKAGASAKGAKDVGALNSEDFSSLTAGSYVVYSGVFHKRPEAEKALAGLKKSFPGASVIAVSNSASGSSSTGGSGGGSSASGAGASESHPAPPKVLEELHKTKGKSYEEKSKNLPDVVGT